MAFDPRELLNRTVADPDPPVPLGGTRAERLQRLQIGIFGIFAMVLLIGLADIVISRVEQSEATAVPEAAPTMLPDDGLTPRDPLVDAGVAPELPADGTAPGEGAPTADESRSGQNAPLQ